MTTAASFLERFDARLAEKSGDETQVARIDNLQQLAAIYSQLQRYDDLTEVYSRLTELQPDNADNFVFYGIAAMNAGNDKVALLAFQRYLELAPEGQYVSEVNARITQLTRTASPSAEPSTSPSP